MPATIPITKMHGLGNCYVYINEFAVTLAESSLPGLAVRLADVHTGVGADGMILIGPSDRAAFRMRIFNADGSEGRSCGNGLRCVAKYVYERGMTDETTFTVETLGGIVRVDIHADPAAKAAGKRRVQSVSVNMGRPRLLKREVPMLGEPDSRTVNEPVTIGGKTYRITAVSMGNPHAVLFVDDVYAVPLAEIGPAIERAPLFPERTNVEIIRVAGERELEFRVWERGSGITQACGTGACAAVVAGVLNGKLRQDVPVTVHLPGGDLDIIWSSATSEVTMTGPAEFVFDGEFLLGDA